MLAQISCTRKVLATLLTDRLNFLIFGQKISMGFVRVNNTVIVPGKGQIAKVAFNPFYAVVNHLNVTVSKVFRPEAFAAILA